MAEEILIDADNMTLERLDRYFFQRREREAQGKKSSQDWFLEMLTKIMRSLDEEEKEGVSYPSDDLQQTLRLVIDKLDQLDKKIVPKEHTPRAEQFAKVRVQAMATYLWGISPNMSQPEMASHEAVFNLAITGGKRYRLETVIKWVAEVDPRAPEKKRGRPRKAKI